MTSKDVCRPPVNAQHPCRLFGILAGEAKVGVLLRRGPSDWVRLVKWNTTDDTFEFGQWYKGRIYEQSCDLSPDGRLFVYLATKYSRKTLADHPSVLEAIKERIFGRGKEYVTHYGYAWTAVSKPPWFTALALWPRGDTWGGGGVFEDDGTLWLNHGLGDDLPHKDHRPTGLTVHRYSDADEDQLNRLNRLHRDGWTLEQQGKFPHSWTEGWKTEQEEIYSKRSTCGRYELLMIQKAIDFKAYGGPYVVAFSVRDVATNRIRELGNATWADWDHQNRLVLAADGQLLFSNVAVDGGYRLRLIHDFNDDKPRGIESPPEARSWD